MKTYIYKLFTYSLIIFLLNSCEFGDTNVNPAVPTDVSMSALLPSGEAAISWAVGGEMVRFSGLLTQQFQGINAQQLDNYQYLIREADTDGVWGRMYFNSLNTINTVIEKADAQNAPHYKGVAQVLMALGVSTLTDAFGDIPYTQSFQGDEGIFQVTYDTQQDLYSTILPGLLNDAIANLSAAESPGGSPGGDDLIFGGTLGSWIIAANSLNMRIAFQSAKQNNTAYDNALALLPNAITSNDEDFEMFFGTGANETNPQYQFGQSRSGNMRMSSYFFNFFDANDSRKPLFVNGDNDSNFEFSGYYTRSESPVVLMSYVEVKFIEAESQLMRTASDPNAAKAALDVAVAASFTKVTGATTPAAYQASLDANWAAATTQEEQLEVLINEKYISCYSQGILAWTDYRRTGYPALTIIPTGTNAFNANGEVPRRLPYPQEERLLNLDNLPIKTPNLQTRFWWDQ
jgi:hypothetical protein